jgi:glucokinase
LVIEAIEKLEVSANHDAGALLALGLCIPGIAYQKSGKVWAPNIGGWDHYPLREKICERVHVPFVIDSDRSAYILGEQWQGAARGARNAVFLAVGTGIGAGILVDGQICRGSEDIAGAVGWFALCPDFKEEYARMGCFEAEASGASVGRKARRLLEESHSALLMQFAKGDRENITAETVADAARKGDSLSQKIVAETVSYLAMGIANIVSLLNPEIVVLGGGLFQAGDLLLEPIRREFKRWAQPLSGQTVRIELSKLGPDAGLFGCGWMAWDLIKKGEKGRSRTGKK